MATGTREEAKKASREALVQAAMVLFPKQGLDVSLDEVCLHAGYTRGAFYVHFKTRDELILEVMSRLGQQWLDSMFGGAEENGDLLGLVQRFAGELTAGRYPLTRAGGMRPYQLLDACARSPAIRERYLRFIDDSVRQLATRIVNSQRQQHIKPMFEADTLATLLVALVIGVHTLHDLDYPLDLGKASLTALQMLA